LAGFGGGELVARRDSIETVSILLGHSSVKVTEEHYSPWVKAWQDRLEAAVVAIWEMAQRPDE
jgi:integrase/recombinase XerD